MSDNDDLQAGWAPGCPDAQTLNDYADETLDDDRRPVIEAHIADCMDCRAWVSDLFAVMALLGDPNADPAPRSFRLGPQYRRPIDGTSRQGRSNNGPARR
ncbi:MAG TPA: zf-HC2 domain-containing protein [Thermomicrobiales bacterium]|jgi:anti-sigma factor RsiW|nr:zf-HC2 domain-containing protein [Thermomicrobiales bacterium]